jgi:hypothetical protein
MAMAVSLTKSLLKAKAKKLDRVSMETSRSAFPAFLKRFELLIFALFP